ncbi:MAG: UbiX family flavin prenyltransferase [Theionarchaea archaeon]|nr:UbiX family flavin prenyltransferase [Theionarchaea archaeon]
MKIIVGITGASGAVYGIRLLEVLKEDITLIVSAHGKELLEVETPHTLNEIKKNVQYYEDSQLDAPISSGSHIFDAMVVVPCSVSTLSKIACGISDTLITRCAAVALKERRTLILVPRETPLSTIHLQNMAALSMQGVIVLPAMPGFYPRPSTIEDVVDFVVGKILDQLRIDHHLFERWTPDNHSTSFPHRSS